MGFGCQWFLEMIRCIENALKRDSTILYSNPRSSSDSFVLLLLPSSCSFSPANCPSRYSDRRSRDSFRQMLTKCAIITSFPESSHYFFTYFRYILVFFTALSGIRNEQKLLNTFLCLLFFPVARWESGAQDVDQCNIMSICEHGILWKIERRREKMTMESRRDGIKE